MRLLGNCRRPYRRGHLETQCILAVPLGLVHLVVCQFQQFRRCSRLRVFFAVQALVLERVTYAAQAGRRRDYQLALWSACGLNQQRKTAFFDAGVLMPIGLLATKRPRHKRKNQVVLYFVSEWLRSEIFRFQLSTDGQGGASNTIEGASRLDGG